MARKKQSEPADAEIIEGEVIDEDEAVEEAAAPTGESSKPRTAVTKRIPWILAACMALFVAGLFAAPWAEATLRSWFPNWMPTEEVTASPVSAEVLALGERVAALERRTTITERGSADLSADVRRVLDGEASRDAELRTLSDRVVALSGEIDAVSAQIAPAVDTSALAARIAELESRPRAVASEQPAIDPERLLALEAQVAALATERDALSASLSALADERSGAAATQSGLALSLAALARPLHDGSPFEAEFASVQQRVESSDATLQRAATPYLDALAAHRTTGIETRAALQRGFDPALRSALSIEQDGDEPGWADRLWDGITNVVRVRRVGEVEGENAEAVLARAEVRVAAGELREAVAELSALPQAEATAVAPWVAGVETRLAAESALSALVQMVAEMDRRDIASEPSP